jgi:hypothetical protein
MSAPGLPRVPGALSRDDQSLSSSTELCRRQFSVMESSVRKKRNRDLDLILCGMFELRLTSLENDRLWNEIGDPAEKLGVDRSAMFFGAPPPERIFAVEEGGTGP